MTTTNCSNILPAETLTPATNISSYCRCRRPCRPCYPGGGVGGAATYPGWCIVIPAAVKLPAGFLPIG